MPGLLGDFTSWWDNRKRVGADYAQGLLTSPVETLGLLANRSGQDVQQIAQDRLYNLGAMSSVMPEVRQQGEQAVLGGGLLGMTAYHGSPHLFDKFDMSKIGTGEGAQAYGHGLYFAENPAVAGGYANGLSKASIEGRAINFDDPIEVAAHEVHIQGGNMARAADRLYSGAQQRTHSALPSVAKKASEILDGILEGRAVQLPKIQQGNTYKVDIPDEAVAKMLDWDKPLYRQSPVVRHAIRDIVDTKFGGGTYAQWIKAARPDMKDLRSNMLESMDEAQISAELLKRGVPGTKYKDAGSRGTEGGTSNFVLFDDSLAKILSRE